MEDKDIYKVYQLMSYFITKFSYNTFLVKGLDSGNDIWLVNSKNNTYQIIRLSGDSLDTVPDEKERIEKHLLLMRSLLHLKDARFLDIHVCNEECYEDDYYDTLCLDLDYFDTTITDINAAFPGINNVIHEVEDGEAEITRCINEIKNNSKIARKQALAMAFSPCFVTYTIIAICCLFYLASLYLSRTYSDVASYIFLGADYKIFTLSLGQFWRLLTYCFNHGSLYHLFMNMLSFYFLGRVFEYKYGHLKFSIMLFVSVIVAALTHGILTGNTIEVGLSGGIYALFVVYIIYLIRERGSINQLLPVIIINIFINFMPNVSWQAHLGGAICGIIFYFMYENDNMFKSCLICLIALFISLNILYFTKKDIYPLYGGTDLEVVQIYRDLGLKNQASKMEKKLIKIYEENY